MAVRVLIVDSGMKNLGGHNFSYTRAVEDALGRRGITATVLANKNLPGDLARASGYQQVFSLGAYDYPPGNGPIRDLMHLYAQSVIYSDELEQVTNRLSIEDYALVFCHTVNDFELIAWARYLSRHKLSGHLMVLLRQTPGFTSCNRLKLIAHPYWRIKPRYLGAIHAKLGDKFILLTDSEALSEDYARIYRHRITTLPIPVNGFISGANSNVTSSSTSIQARYGLAPDGGIRIGYMGDAREAKGFLLLPELVRRVISRADIKAKFVIQCPNPASGYSNGQPPGGVPELQKLAQEAPDKVTLVYEKLCERDYADLFRCLDVALIPYLATNYVEATSGIFAEAVALSKPVVVPSGTWMARELRKFGGGVEFQKGDVDDLTLKVLKLVRQYEEYALKAQQFSLTWRNFHNPDTLVDILLKESHLDSVTRQTEQ